MLVVADILKPRNINKSWINKRLGQAIAAKNFYSVELYQQAALKEGLELVEVYDISDNVRNTFPLWTKAHIRKFGTLLRQYRLTTLIKIGLALFLGPIITTQTMFSYEILVFAKK